MSHWNHRIVKHDKDPDRTRWYYAIHEVFYEDDNSIYAITTDPIAVVSEEKEDILETLKWMIDCYSKPVLSYIALEKIWEEKRKKRKGKKEKIYPLDIKKLFAEE